MNLSSHRQVESNDTNVELNQTNVSYQVYYYYYKKTIFCLYLILASYFDLIINCMTDCFEVSRHEVLLSL